MIRGVPFSKRLLPWLALSLALSPLIAVCLLTLGAGTVDLALEGDHAMLDISTRNAATGRSLLGPYSRFGFNHPGPLYLFLRMPVMFASGFLSSSHYVTVAALIAASVAAAFLIILRMSGGTTATAFCLATLVYLAVTPPIEWLQDWNPFVIAFPFLLYSVSIASVGAGRCRWLPVAVFSSSLVAQTHIGGAPVVAAMAVAASVPWLLAGRRASSAYCCKKRPLAASAVILAAIWLPVLIQELLPGEGNIARIFRFLGENPASVGVKVAMREWSGALMASETWLFFPKMLRAWGILMHVVFVMALVRLLALAVCALLLRKAGRGGFMSSLAVVLIVAQAVMFLGVLQVRGGLHSYLFSWFSITSLLTWLVFAGTAIELAGRCLARSRAYPIILLPIMLIPAFMVIRPLAAPHAGAYDPLGYEDESVRVLSAGLERYFSAHPGGCWYLEPSPRDLWPVAAGVVNRLAKNGHDVHLDPYFSGLVGVSTPVSAKGLLLVGPANPPGESAVAAVSAGDLAIIEPPAGGR